MRTFPEPIKFVLRLPYRATKYFLHFLKFFLLDIKIKRYLHSDLQQKNNRAPTLDDTPLIISLTSYPARFYQLHYTLYSIMQQQCKADKVILWLTEQECPNGRKCVPQKILAFEKYGLEITFSRDNLRPYNKIIHALRAYPNATIITLDDDIYYADFVIQTLVESYKKYPKDIHCHVAKRAYFKDSKNIAPYHEWEVITNKYNIHKKSFTPSNSSLYNLQFGFAGVLYPPHSLYKDAIDSEIFLQLSPTSDDIWLWAMAVLNSTKIRFIEKANANPDVISVQSSQKYALWKTNDAAYDINGKNQKHLEKILAYYPQILEILKKEQ